MWRHKAGPLDSVKAKQKIALAAAIVMGEKEREFGGRGGMSLFNSRCLGRE